MLIYVDHIIIASSSDSTVNKLMQQLTGEFAIKDLGTLNYFLGIEVKQQRDGLILSQKHYALDLLKIACMEKEQFPHPWQQLRDCLDNKAIH